MMRVAEVAVVKVDPLLAVEMMDVVGVVDGEFLKYAELRFDQFSQLASVGVQAG